MQVILMEKMANLGQLGDVVKVKNGYARNFLLPKGLALEANLRNVKALEHDKRKIQETVKKAKSGAEELSSKIAAVTITIKAKAGEEDKLFGSVTAMDIAEALKQEGLDIDRRKIVLEEPIKRLGNFTVSVKVHPEVSAQFTVQVVSE